MTPPAGEACKPWDVVCWSSEGIGNVVSQASNDALQQFVNNILEGYGKAIVSLGTLWVNVPSPVTVVDRGGGVNGGGAPPVPEAFETILGYVTWVTAGLAVMSLIVAGVMMSARRRYGDGEAHLGRIGVILLAVIILSSASALVTGFLPLAMHLNESSSVVGWVQGQLEWYAGGLAILSILVAAGRMIWTQRAAELRTLARSVLTLIAVAGAGLVVIRLATQAGDEFSVWILNRSTDCDVTNGESNCFGTNVFAMISLTATSGIGLIGLFLLGILAVLMTYIQVALMIFRGAMLVVLAGIFPIAAAATNTEIGQQWFKKTMAWTLAFILYKPAAAIVYAIAFRMTGTDLFKSDGTGLFQIVTGLALMLIALVALPALMRFLVPAVSSVGGSGGGAGLLLGAAAVSGAGDIATGAIRSRAGGDSGGGGGAPGGSGGFGSAPTGSNASAGSTGSPASASAPGGASSAAGGGAAVGGSAGGAATSAGVAAAGGGAAAAAAGGPIGIGVMAASKAAEGAKQATGAVKAATEDATGGNGSGN
ncbi:hypothetical protein NB037_02420 [Rathayibacter sp. ZW T2_19]|uniref:TrbL/VirB6 plasmid conjugal transfer protein n=1 Tax=Rathayibacter rubneri TaxID=2950106 RepID=A0A9X2IT44_9MICO|nr:hypothetical protein [Rathayibacter rubneri]MCM6761264.1 hypothetical protein [Rathayibacter rubneri]